MILGHSELRKLMKKHALVTGLAERELESPEGCVFDLRLDKVFELKGKAFIGIEERETPDLVELAAYDPKRVTKFVFEPGKYYLTKTIEEVDLPKNITAIIKPRGTTVRSGLMLRAWIADPGYRGALYFGMFNAGNISVEMELGARFVQVFFVEIKGEAVNLYRGQWQGGRDTTKGREVQI